MKKMILVLALLGFSAAAQAGDYERAAHKQRICSGFGEIAAMENSLKREGMPREVMDKEAGTSTGYALTTLNTIYSSQMTDQEAHMVGWADCMDAL